MSAEETHDTDAARPPHRQGPHDPDRRARHGGGDGARRPHHRAPLRRDPGRGHAGRDPGRIPASRRSTSRHEPAARPSPEPLVTVDGIHTYYGKSHVLHGVSLEVGRGEVVGLLGRNGVGKSTTLKAIMRPRASQRRRGGVRGPADRPAAAAPASRGSGIGYVPEDRRIFPLLTVLENLRTGLDRARRRRRRRRPSCSTRSTPTSRSSPSGATRPAARCRAASSRCWRSPGR